MIDSISTVPLLDYNIYNGDLSDCARAGKTLINTINQYSFCIAEKDVAFKTALQESDILLPDGIAIVAAVQLLSGIKIKKIAGADIHQYLLDDLNKKEGRCFYLGSSDNTLLKITTRLSIDFPNIKVGSFSPPYKSDFSYVDNQQIISEINAFKPDVLFVGMTAPKQEKWSFIHKNEVDAKIICSIGAVFDFYAGTVNRPSQFWINLGLEWFIRLCNEPKRMWKRYLYYGPLFVKSIILQKIKSFK